MKKKYFNRRLLYVPFELRRKSIFWQKVCSYAQTCMYWHGSTEISSHVHSFQDEAEAANNAVLSFHSREVTKTNR